MRNSFMALLSVLLMAAGCSDSTEPAPPSMAGTWSGNFGGASITFTATETAGNVSGNGHIASGTEPIAVTVSGTHAHPNVALTIRATGYQNVAFAGQFVSDTQVSGRLNGSGFNNEQFVITRR